MWPRRAPRELRRSISAITNELIDGRLQGSRVDSAEYMLTGRAEAIRVQDQPAQPRAREKGDVYLVVLTGQLVLTKSSVRFGFPMPTGNYAAFSIDAATHEVLDFRIWKKPYDISDLGSVGTVPLR